MLLDDHTPDERGPVVLDDAGGLGRLSGLVGPLNWRVGLVVGLALLTGAGATLATADFGGTAEPEELTARIETDALPAVGGQTASTLDQAGSTDPELLQSDGVLASLAVDESDDTTSTTDPTTSTSDPSTTSDPSSTTSTTLPGVSAPANDASGSTSTTDSSSSTTSGGTSTSGATTSERTTTSRGTTGSSTTSRQTTTTRQGTTQATTATTRATTTTTRPTTTTTVQTTTTAQPTTTQAGNSCATGAEFELIMRDDFNGSSIGGQWLQWNQSAGNRGNGLRMASALNVSSGVLTITANMQDGTLISGGLNHTEAQTYGKYRVRVRTDVDPSRAMSGVVLTWPASNVHPRDGENNMYETLPHQDSATRNPFYTFIHKPFGGTGDQEYKIWRADAAQWQTMTMEWTPSRITVTRDGGESWTVNETGADLIPDVPHRFHMQLDAFQSSISSQVTMQVDFAEVYRYCG